MTEADEGINGTLCIHCESGRIWYAEPEKPYKAEQYVCDNCLSTYTIRKARDNV